LYTIPTNDQTKRYTIEHFYGEKIDGVFPEVYEILVNDSINYIDFEMRIKIITTALSFYFRTPKFLNSQNKLVEDMIRDLAKMTKKDTISYSFLGDSISFNKSEIEAVITEKKEKNRILFLAEHLRSFERLVNLKLKNGIVVNKIIDDSELITSDNPVIMRPYFDMTEADNDKAILNPDIDPFDPQNMIHVPLNNKYVLTIMPAMDEVIIDTIERNEITKLQSMIYNYDIDYFAEKWILGSKNGVILHLKDQEEFSKDSPENIRKVEDYRVLVEENQKLLDLMEKYGAGHEKVKDKVDQMKDNPIIASDPNFQSLVNRIK
jgi:hypothetical protein